MTKVLRSRRLLLLPLGLIAALALTAPALAAPPTGNGSGGVRLTPIGSFDAPVHVENAPVKKARKGRKRGKKRKRKRASLLFVVEQGGRVIVLRNGVRQPEPFLDIRGRVQGPTDPGGGGEQGLLSIAFHPRYAKNRRFYVYFTNSSGHNEIVEFKRRRSNQLKAKLGSARRLLVIPHPTDAQNHNGGQLQFGPGKLLYAAPGDGGSTAEAAQDRNSLRGKVLRINPVPKRKRKKKGRKGRKSGEQAAAFTYRIPKSNPFVGRPGRDEIYSLGLRNPYRFSFDAVTKALTIADVGAGAREEVDFRRRGRGLGVNFGWPRFEGDLLINPGVSAPGAVPPIHDYSHAGGNCAITGGFVVRDPRLRSLYARYLYADFCVGVLRSLIPRESGAIDDQAVGGGLPVVPNVSSFGEGSRRKLYVSSLSGPVYRLDPS